MLDDIGSDVLEDIHVGLGQLQAGLAGLAGEAGGNDHHIGACGVRIAAGPDNGGRAEGGALVDVHGLTERLLLIDVNEHDFCGHVGRHHVVGDGGADAARADDRDFVAHNYFSFSI